MSPSPKETTYVPLEDSVASLNALLPSLNHDAETRSNEQVQTLLRALTTGLPALLSESDAQKADKRKAILQNLLSTLIDALRSDIREHTLTTLTMGGALMKRINMLTDKTTEDGMGLALKWNELASQHRKDFVDAHNVGGVQEGGIWPEETAALKLCLRTRVGLDRYVEGVEGLDVEVRGKMRKEREGRVKRKREEESDEVDDLGLGGLTIEERETVEKVVQALKGQK